MKKAEIIKIGRGVLEIESRAISALIPRLDDNFSKAVDLLAENKSRIIVIGMGKSGLIGRKIAATLASCGTPALFLHPAEATSMAWPPPTRHRRGVAGRRGRRSVGTSRRPRSGPSSATGASRCASDVGPSRRRLVPQHAPARVRPRSREVRHPVRRAVALRHAAPRRRDRPRPDPADRVPARRLPHRARRGHCLSRAGGIRRVVLARAGVGHRSVALDTSSRTSVALLQVLCAERFGIAPAFVPHGPDLPGMLAACDAALMIGDPALWTDPHVLGVTKTDLGAEWTTHTTGLVSKDALADLILDKVAGLLTSRKRRTA